ncbi:glutathione S-transferase L3-like [Telopea speciosissima]|uniref:glutathione S-transferase L3-like n=1 Tax=Telopea speciosissima TaxID=54955 RepID=UPI001CC46F63|nr:glutathione S-transferase L3-like [Telopea speciosissima]
MATAIQETLPTPLDSTSSPPSIFDGTTRLYTNYLCPYAQRVWITRNAKGLQDKITLVAIDLQNRPAWYKEKVNLANKVPALEHNNKIVVESLDLIKYIDSNFEGLALLPDDLQKREYGEELLTYTNTFNSSLFTSLKDPNAEEGAPFDHLENALSKFDDGPFFLGQFSQVDIAYAPFIERFQLLLLDMKNYDITIGRPQLTAWIEEMDKIEAYKQTKRDPEELVTALKRHLSRKQPPFTGK